MDATGTGAGGARVALRRRAAGALLAADQPERVDGVVYICPVRRRCAERPEARAIVEMWNEELDTDEGWAKYNRHYWLKDYPGFLEYFFSQMFTEPHSTKPIEDCVGWGLETDPGDAGRHQARRASSTRRPRASWPPGSRCPVLVIQGSDDAIRGAERGVALAEATGGDLVMLEGSGHGPHVRDPVKVNLLLREFVAPARPPARWVRGKSAPQARALHLIPDRARARAARRRDRGGAARPCTRTSRSTGSPRTR